MTEIPANPPWQRLSPLTMLLAIINRVPGTLQWVPALAAIGLSYGWIYVIPALLLLHMANVAIFWWWWIRFRWKISGTAILIESGILERKHRTIPFDRIQDVSIEQGLLARVMDVAKVGLETGAATGKDGEGIKLDAISMPQASALRETIRAWRVGSNPATTDAPVLPGHEPDQVLFTLTPRNLFLAGIFNFSLAALGLVGAMATWLDDFIAFDITKTEDWDRLLDETGILAWADTHRWLVGMGLALTLLLVGLVTGLVRTTLANWDFRLSLGPRAFRRTRGLTTRTDVAITLSRIQAAIVTTGIIRRRWGWHALWLQSLASDSAAGSSHQVIPFATLEDIDTVLAVTGTPRPPEKTEWHVPPLLAQVASNISIATASGIIGLLATSLGHWEGTAGMVLAAAIVVLTPFLARTHRWADDGTRLYIWRGWLSPRLTIIPFTSVQSADLRQGPLLRHLGCVRFRLGIPGESLQGTHAIKAIPLFLALDLRRRILSTRSTHTRTRMGHSPSNAGNSPAGDSTTPAAQAHPFGSDPAAFA